MIILRFPGIGKTTLNGDKYIDLDGAPFYDSKFHLEIYLKTAAFLSQNHIVMIGYHKKIVDYILSNNCKVLAVVPTLDQKEEYFKRYKNRDQPYTYDYMQIHFEKILKDLKRLPYLEIRGYLSDNIEKVINHYSGF